VAVAAAELLTNSIAVFDLKLSQLLAFENLFTRILIRNRCIFRDDRIERSDWMSRCITWGRTIAFLSTQLFVGGPSGRFHASGQARCK